VADALSNLGLHGETLTAVHAVLMYAQKRGSSQGLAKIRERTILPDPGIDPVMGTNPIAIAIPTSSGPLVLDMATAATTWFALISARDHNQPIADDVAVDRDGNSTTSAEEAIAGALRTFGGNKGSGLALMFEMLTGPLTHAAIAGEDTDNRGNLIIGIDPKVVLGDDSFIARADQLVETIRNGRRPSVRLPGDNSDALARQCEVSNSITLDRSIYQHVCELANSAH